MTAEGGEDPLAGGGGGGDLDDDAGPAAEDPGFDDDDSGPSDPFTPEPTAPAPPSTAAGDCLEDLPPSHDGHGHVEHRSYTRAEVCEDEICAGGATVLACIERTQGEYRSCERAAEERRDATARSPTAADRAEAERCGDRARVYVPMRAWQAYHEAHERCLDAYDASLRACIGAWPIRARPPRLRAGPAPVVPSREPTR